MSASVVRLAGSSKSVFTAWQALRKSADKDSARQGKRESWAAGQPDTRNGSSD